MDAGDTEDLVGIEHLEKMSAAKSEFSVKAHLAERSGGRCSLVASKHWNFIILGTYMD